MEEIENEWFRTLYIVEPSHDLSVVKDYTDNIKFITTGTELVEGLAERVSASLEDFDPEEDAIIPMGRTSACLITGLILRSKIPKGGTVKIGVYKKDSKYVFVKVVI